MIAHAAVAVSATAMMKLSSARSVNRPKMTSFSPPAIAAIALPNAVSRRCPLDGKLVALHPVPPGDDTYDDRRRRSAGTQSHMARARRGMDQDHCRRRTCLPHLHDRCVRELSHSV